MCLGPLSDDVHNPAPGDIPRRELQPDPVTDQHPDEVAAGSAGHVCRNLPLTLEPDPIQPVRQLFQNRSFNRACLALARVILGRAAALVHSP